MPVGKNPPKIYSLATDKFTASVLVESKEVPLYGIEHSNDGKTVTCWVESESGKSFGVRWTASERAYDTSGHLYVDGIFCGSRVRFANGKNKSIYSKIDYCKSGSTKRNLIFSDIETTDDDAFYGQAISEDFGSIKLTMHRMEVMGHGRIPDPVPEKCALEKVHEKSKKAMRHQMRLGEERPRESGYVHGIDHEDLVTFIFRYRPMDFLRAEGIAPLAASRPAARVGEKRNADDEGFEEEDEGGDDSQAKDEAKLKQLLAEVGALQSKLANNGPGRQKGPNKRIKTEARPVKISNEIIDLTEE